MASQSCREHQLTWSLDTAALKLWYWSSYYGKIAKYVNDRLKAAAKGAVNRQASLGLLMVSAAVAVLSIVVVN